MFGYFQVMKYDIRDNACVRVDFPIVGESYRSGTAIRLPLTGTGEGRENVKISACRVLTGTAKDEEWI